MLDVDAVYMLKVLTPGGFYSTWLYKFFVWIHYEFGVKLKFLTFYCWVER